jgi:hypothetical protein
VVSIFIPGEDIRQEAVVRDVTDQLVCLGIPGRGPQVSYDENGGELFTNKMI